MAAQITVQATPNANGWDCAVTVSEQGSQTRHAVRLTRAYLEKLTGGAKVSPEVLVEKSFEFLLQREPKESILRSFDLSVISHYFPEYEEHIRQVW
jgi:hypothetical protein